MFRRNAKILNFYKKEKLPENPASGFLPITLPPLNKSPFKTSLNSLITKFYIKSLKTSILEKIPK